MARRRKRRSYGDVSTTVSLVTLGVVGVAAYLLLRRQGSTAGSPQPGLLAPGILQTAYDVGASQAATNETSCKSAGGVWVRTGLFGLGSKGICTDPQRSSAACQQAGGTWLGAGCQFPGDQSI